MKTGTPRRSGTAIGTYACVYLSPRFFMFRFRIMRKEKSGTPRFSGIANSCYEKEKPVHRGTRGLPSRIESSKVQLTLQVLLRRQHGHSSSVTNIADHYLQFERFGFQFLLSVLMKYVSFALGYRDSSFSVRFNTV